MPPIRGVKFFYVSFVCSWVVANQNTQLGFTKAFWLRDPDRHVIEIEQRKQELGVEHDKQGHHQQRPHQPSSPGAGLT